MLRVFPVAGRSQFADTWGAARDQQRQHEGTDIFAAEGTPVLAVNDGMARKGNDSLGGQVATLTDADARYYYAHLSGWEGEFPRKVKAGDVLGYVGTTGNAAGKSPHLHFGKYVNNVAENPFAELTAARLLTAPGATPAASSPGSSPSNKGMAGALLAVFVLWSLSNTRSARRASA